MENLADWHIALGIGAFFAAGAIFIVAAGFSQRDRQSGDVVVRPTEDNLNVEPPIARRRLMALIKCSECGRDISDKAEACPGCGALVSLTVNKPTPLPIQPPPSPVVVHYDRATDTFTGTMVQMVKLAMRAIQRCGWKLDTVNETIGLVTFQTGMSLNSWSGILCSLNIEEISPDKFRVSGTGKQNLTGDQLFAFNLFGEAQGRAHKAIEMMKSLVVSEDAGPSLGRTNSRNDSSDARGHLALVVAAICLLVAVLLSFVGNIFR